MTIKAIEQVCFEIEIKELHIKQVLKNVDKVSTFHPLDKEDILLYVRSLIKVLFEPHQNDDSFKDFSRAKELRYIQNIARKLKVKQSQVNFTLFTWSGITIIPNF